MFKFSNVVEIQGQPEIVIGKPEIFMFLVEIND